MPPNDPRAYLNGLSGGNKQRLDASGSGVQLTGTDEPMNLTGDVGGATQNVAPVGGGAPSLPPEGVTAAPPEAALPQPNHPTTDMLLQGIQSGDPEAMTIIGDILNTFMEQMDQSNQAVGGDPGIPVDQLTLP